MSMVNRRKSLLMELVVICLIALSMMACGRKGDLYLPEHPAAVKSSPATQEPAETEKEEKQKKDENGSTE